jgi:diguanylate cyclase (GGDEF)-like protein
MISLRRALTLGASVAVAAVALGAAVGVVQALLSWSAHAEATASGRAVVASWPRAPLDYVELLAVALAALIGIALLTRRAIELTAKPKPPQRRSSDHELARLVTEARTDSLTRLGNHRAFHDDLAAEVDRRNSTGSLFSLMAIDLDGLKAVNDTQGHQAGDAHIVRLAQAIKTEIGVFGSVYRTGGDEFMVLLPSSRNWHAINLAHKMLAATKSRAGARTLSIGVTETKGTEHRQALVRQADLALYEAKRATLGIVPFRPGMEPVGATRRPAHELSPDQRTLAAALARAVDARDLGTHDHSERVAELAASIGAQHDIEGDKLERLRVAALLHDVGKIAVPDAILTKQAPLASGEQDLMRHHVAVGRDILVAAGFFDEAVWVYHHHEHTDGTGYPDGLSGSEIPLPSRIIAVADAFEAMTGSRPYRENLSAEQALAELLDGAGKQFDPSCVRALAELVSGNLPAALLAPLQVRSRVPDPPSGGENPYLQSGTGLP